MELAEDKGLTLTGNLKEAKQDVRNMVDRVAQIFGHGNYESLPLLYGSASQFVRNMLLYPHTLKEMVETARGKRNLLSYEMLKPSKLDIWFLATMMKIDGGFDLASYAEPSEQMLADIKRQGGVKEGEKVKTMLMSSANDIGIVFSTKAVDLEQKVTRVSFMAPYIKI